MSRYDTSWLVTNVLRKITAPAAEQLNTNFSRVIEFLNDEMEGVMIPTMLGVKEEFFLTFEEFALGDYSTTSGYYYLPIPADAMFEAVRYVTWAAQNGWGMPMTRLSLENAVGSGANNSYNFGNFIFVNGFYLQDNDIVVNANSNVGDGSILRVYFMRRPSYLVPVEEGCQVVSVNTITNEIVVSAVPSDWTTADTLDCVPETQPFKPTRRNMTIVNISSPTIELESVEDIEAGNWITLYGETVFAQLPVEGLNVLCQSAACRLLEGLTDNSGLPNALRTFEQYKTAFVKNLTPRTQGQPKVINNIISGFNAGMTGFGTVPR